uniref:Uncharacterized protein n=1 Tax=Arundo donax TaxID=35708 RepID=A0A0A9A0C8_ARUDO
MIQVARMDQYSCSLLIVFFHKKLK